MSLPGLGRFFLPIKQIVLILLVLIGCAFPVQAAPVVIGDNNPVLIKSTPYDNKLSRTGLLAFTPVDFFHENESRSIESLFLRAKAFRYLKDRKGDIWQTPQETERKGSGDCEDKAVWLFHRLRQNGYENVRLVIGKYKSISAGYHVWVTYADKNSASYILDPAAQKRIWKSDDFANGFYRPLYSFDGQNRYRYP